jgi:hypothetical protein
MPKPASGHRTWPMNFGTGLAFLTGQVATTLTCNV